jgi:hypothetical protein
MGREAYPKDVVKIVLFLVPHTFDWSLKPHRVSGKTYLEVGHNDVGVVLAVSEETGALFVMVEPPEYVNKSVAAFFDCVKVTHDSAVLKDGKLSNEARLEFFRRTILGLDPTSLSDPRSFWSLIAEQIEYGLL